MATEYRPIVNSKNGPIPHYLTFPKPDVIWGSWYHYIRASDVLWWESHEVNSDGSATAWTRVTEADD